MRKRSSNNDRFAVWLKRLMLGFFAAGASATYYWEDLGWVIIGGLMTSVLGIIYIAHVLDLIKPRSPSESGSNGNELLEKLGGDNGGGVNTNGTHMADNYNDIHGHTFGLGDD